MLTLSQMMSKRTDLLRAAREVSEADKNGRASDADFARAEFNVQEAKSLKAEIDRRTANSSEAVGCWRSNPTDLTYGGGGTCYKDAGGATLRTLTASEPMGDGVNGGDYPVGQLIMDRLTGNATEGRSPFAGPVPGQYGDTESGGALLTPTLSKRVVDLARANSVVIRAGAETMPMDSPELVIAQVSEDPTGYWRPEGSSVTASGLAFTRVTLRAKTLAAVVPVTLESMEDVANFSQVIESSLAAALGVQLDYAALAGAGAASEPQGVYNAADVNEQSSVGTPTNFSEVTAAIGDIVDANYPHDIGQLSWIQSPRDAELIDSLVDTLGQPLQMTPWVSKLKRFYTSSISDTLGSGADSWGIVGHFPSMVIGMRTTGVVIRILDAGVVTDSASVSHNAASQLLYHIVAHMRADVALLRPTWFTKMTGITTT